MNKAELIEAVQSSADIETRAQAERCVNAVFDSIRNELGKGGEVAVTGFGSFKTVKRVARQGINPKTGEKIQIPAMTRPKFSAGKGLKDAVK